MRECRFRRIAPSPPRCRRVRPIGPAAVECVRSATLPWRAWCSRCPAESRWSDQDGKETSWKPPSPSIERLNATERRARDGDGNRATSWRLGGAALWHLGGGAPWRPAPHANRIGPAVTRRRPIAVYRVIDEEELLGGDRIECFDTTQGLVGDRSHIQPSSLRTGRRDTPARFTGWVAVAAAAAALACVALLLLQVRVQAPTANAAPAGSRRSRVDTGARRARAAASPSRAVTTARAPKRAAPPRPVARVGPKPGVPSHTGGPAATPMRTPLQAPGPARRAIRTGVKHARAAAGLARGRTDEGAATGRVAVETQPAVPAGAQEFGFER